MGDMGAQIFGGGSTTTANQTPDPNAQALNNQRVQQLAALFGGTPYADFASPQSDIFTPPPETADLYNFLMGQFGSGQDSATQAINEARTNVGGSTAGMNQAASSLEQIGGALTGMQGADIAGIQQLYGPILERMYGGTDTALAGYGQGIQAANDILPSLESYIELGMDAGRNYISQIASPEIRSQLALQGLEGGGALSEALGRATAGIGLEFAQSVPGAAVGFSRTAAQNSGELANLAVQSALGTAGINTGVLGDMADQRIAQYAQQIQAMLGAGDQFARSGALQGQAGQLGLGIGQLGAQSAAQFTSLAPQFTNDAFRLADYGRALSESDLLRRQGVVTTGLTGLPFTPGSSTTQRERQQPLFNFFGQG